MCLPSVPVSLVSCVPGPMCPSVPSRGPWSSFQWPISGPDFDLGQVHSKANPSSPRSGQTAAVEADRQQDSQAVMTDRQTDKKWQGQASKAKQGRPGQDRTDRTRPVNYHHQFRSTLYSQVTRSCNHFHCYRTTQFAARYDIPWLIATWPGSQGCPCRCKFGFKISLSASVWCFLTKPSVSCFLIDIK